MQLSQSELVKKLALLVDECSTFSIFAKRSATELRKIKELRYYLDNFSQELQKEYVRYNLGQKRLRLIQKWIEGDDGMTKVVSMLNMKGGVGKTTLTYNLTWYAAYKKNFKILTVDLDPQSNLSQLFLGDEGYEQFLENDEPSIVDVFEKHNQDPEEVIQEIHNWDDGSMIHIVPSKLELSTTLKNPTSKERRLAKFLNKVKSRYDLIIIDCAPTDSILTVASYLASDFVIIPAKLERLSAIGLPLLNRSLTEFNEEYTGEHKVEVAGIIFNDVNPGNAKENRTSIQKVESFTNVVNWKVFTNKVRRSASFLAGNSEGKPIFQASNARDYVIKEFDDVGQEFLSSVGLK
ncbi:chromosome partitioning protein [Fontibacillus solani]|uniref:Chromosome partitioning protein n=1 Tax=Fontibacillus solani TaxID=1572857 RepID=A0A7W3XRW6_9BACL|nr:ParA family protein [Fontibacillus solani]MBA9085983.1 chromosome partitioning protein [Fontibacillus solani]